MSGRAFSNDPSPKAASLTLITLQPVFELLAIYKRCAETTLHTHNPVQGTLCKVLPISLKCARVCKGVCWQLPDRLLVAQQYSANMGWLATKASMQLQV